jgi:cytochrome-b5 reductase
MEETTDKIFPITLADLRSVTYNTKQFSFLIPPGTKFNFLPGDHIKVYPDPEDPVEWRQYSPTTPPDITDHFELIIKCYDQGMVSRYMHERRVGEEVYISGPHEGGHFVEGMAKHIGMVAGGTGITPMISMIRTIMKRRIYVDVSLIFANKTIEDIILKDEFDRYAQESENFKRFYVVDQAPTGWTMGQGHITREIMKAHLPAPSDQTIIFLCGPPVMELNLREQLTELGYGKNRIINP